jgi:hypothetical protein
MKTCPCCGQSIRYKVLFGEHFGWRKAAIIEALVAAGSLGIDREYLRCKVGNIAMKTLNAHLHQIRQQLIGKFTIAGRDTLILAYLPSTDQLTKMKEGDSVAPALREGGGIAGGAA